MEEQPTLKVAHKKQESDAICVNEELDLEQKMVSMIESDPGLTNLFVRAVWPVSALAPMVVPAASAPGTASSPASQAVSLPVGAQPIPASAPATRPAGSLDVPATVSVSSSASAGGRQLPASAPATDEANIKSLEKKNKK